MSLPTPRASAVADMSLSAGRLRLPRAGWNARRACCSQNMVAVTRVTDGGDLAEACRTRSDMCKEASDLHQTPSYTDRDVLHATPQPSDVHSLNSLDGTFSSTKNAHCKWGCLVSIHGVS